MLDDTDGDISPQKYARLAGWLYLYVIVAALFAEIFVSGRLVVPADAAATAHNILTNQSLFRLAGAANVLVFVCDVVLAWAFYVLLKPVNKRVALLAAFFRLAYAAIMAADIVSYFAALRILGSPPYLHVFTTAQVDALALSSLKAQAVGFDIALIFFGFHVFLLGYLIAGSGYLPKAIGILLLVAGPCYIVNSFAHVIAPGANLDIILFVGFFAELSLCLWLIVKGVNVTKWNGALPRMVTRDLS